MFLANALTCKRAPGVKYFDEIIKLAPIDSPDLVYERSKEWSPRETCPCLVRVT